MRKHIGSFLVGLLVGLPLWAAALSGANGKLDLQGTPLLLALDGSDLTLATEDDDDIKLKLDGIDRLTVDGVTGRAVFNSVTTSISAAGNSQGTATALTARVNRVDTCTATSADGVQLPAAATGEEVIIIASCGQALGVWPASGDKINDGSADAEDALADGAVGTYRAVDGTDWYSVEQ